MRHGAQPLTPERSQTTRTTVVGGSSRAGAPAPSDSTSGSAHPSRRRSSADSATSSAARDPFIASSAPAGDTNGIDQASSRGSGATAREVTTSNRHRPVQLLRPRATDLTARQPELRHRLLQEGGTPQQRFDQGHLQVRARDGQHYPGQPGTGPEVADRGVLGHDLREHGAVHEVPLPQPRHLARTDQAAHHAVAGQHRGVPLGQREALGTEHPPRRRGRGGCLRRAGCFT